MSSRNIDFVYVALSIHSLVVLGGLIVAAYRVLGCRCCERSSGPLITAPHASATPGPDTSDPTALALATTWRERASD